MPSSNSKRSPFGRGWEDIAYRCCQSCRLFCCTEQLLALVSFRLLDLFVVQESDRGAPPNDPVTIMLQPLRVNSPSHNTHRERRNREGIGKMRTSFFVTGLSANTKCVSRVNVPSASTSASSARLLDASTRFRKFGTAAAAVGWMFATRLRASSSVVMRGERGKLPSTWMSLSVKSMASWGCYESKDRVSNGFFFASILPCRTFHPYGEEPERDSKQQEGGTLTPATPKFSMAGIRCPIYAAATGNKAFQCIKQFLSPNQRKEGGKKRKD
jgi:hypothetical protein